VQPPGRPVSTHLPLAAYKNIYLLNISTPRRQKICAVIIGVAPAALINQLIYSRAAAKLLTKGA
jgi:hypothetical protein